ELVAARPQLIVVTGTSEAVAAARATTTIPIVMIHGSYDPVELGLAQSLARPGRNLTGMISTIPGFSAKALEFLIEVLPNAKRIGVLANPAASHFVAFMKELEGVAAAKRITLLPISEAKGPREIDAALAAIAAAKPQAMIVHHDALFFIQRQRIIDFCARARLPAMYRFTEDVEAGGLMSYAAQYRELYARAAIFVEKILKGSKPGDIPIEQPTRFGLWINLKTAEVLGLRIPQAVLLRADRVIE
ncbi:MAG TPA: ABC transporter substrate-binding protein, partial [Steroidobacteraceae bacterium]